MGRGKGAGGVCVKAKFGKWNGVAADSMKMLHVSKTTGIGNSRKTRKTVHRETEDQETSKLVAGGWLVVNIRGIGGADVCFEGCVRKWRGAT
jgi:hypothetical protein